MATVVNVRVKYIKPKYQNLKAWCQDPNNVYIGRKCIVFIDNKRYPEKDSIYANPYKVNTISKEEAITLYRTHLQKLIDTNTITMQDLIDLKGKNLGCWCVTGPKDKHHTVRCHGDIIVDMINKYT